MSINLDTGVVNSPRLNGSSNGLGTDVAGHVYEYNDVTPVDNVVYPSAERSLIVVNPGHMVVVTGYNLIEDTVVRFNKILRSAGVPATGSSSCCPTIRVGNSINLYSVHIPRWGLSQCDPVFVIKTPGVYEVEVSGKAAPDVVITAMSYPIQDHNHNTIYNCYDGLGYAADPNPFAISRDDDERRYHRPWDDGGY